MARVLELAELLQDDGVAEVDVGRRGVQTQLHAQRTAQRQLARELARGQAVDRVSGEARGLLGGFGPWATMLERGSQMRPRPRLKKLRLLLILAGLGLIALLSTAFGMMMAVAADLPDIENRAEFQRARNSVLYDRNDQPLGELTSNDGPRHPRRRRDQPVDAARDHRDRGPALLPQLRRGPEGHRARAPSRTSSRAGAVQGGSTIAQQFVKLALAAQDERTVFQKAREAALAFHLTRKWSKEKILTEYLNSIYFGNGAYGVESAARTYFGIQHDGCGTRRPALRAASSTPAESALLAGRRVIAEHVRPGREPGEREEAPRPRPPAHARAGLSPARGVRRARSRRRCPRRPTSARRPCARASRAAYFVSWVRQQIADRYGARRAFEGGLRIRTTLDVKLQRARRAGGEHAGSSTPGGPQASLVAIDNATGEVPRDGRRRGLRLAPVQPRDAGPAPARLGLQAVRPRDRARARHPARRRCGRRRSSRSPCPARRARRSSSSTTTRTPTSGPRASRTATTLLGQLRLRPGRHEGGPAPRGADGRGPRHPHARLDATPR